MAVATVYSYKAYGAVGDDATDDTAAINNCHAAAVVTGGEVQIDPGIYKITSALTPIDTLITTSGYDGRSVSFRGYGASSRIRYHGADFGTPTALFTYQNSATVVNAGTSDFGYMRDFFVECAGVGSPPAPPRLPNTIGIRLKNRASMRVYNVQARGCGLGWELDGVLSSQFYSIAGRQNLVGIRGFNTNGLSTNNANTFYSPLVGLNWQGGMDMESGGCTIITPNVEGNGHFPTDGTGSGYGLRFTNSNLTGLDVSEETNALNLYGGYFENNTGLADVLMYQDSPRFTKYNISGANFRRIDSLNYVAHNISIVHNGTGGLGYSERDCTFTGYNTYVPALTKKYRQITGTSLARRDLYAPSDNYYESQVETPPLYMPRTTII